ncbi:MAG: glucuronate isomerase [Spirochaetaceae bacterium]|nr:MAG: glucuronate isomerase [Spirochaetaceae bacterium]
MSEFLSRDFLLETDIARKLYFEYAEPQPILDYHCHLSPEDIAQDRQFRTITEIWLAGDHYKWRAMRSNGVAERFITGDATDREKFQAFAETVPYCIGNPLYQWTHLELKRPFGIDDLRLDGKTAETVWERTNEKLAEPAFSVRGILKQMNVKVVCTTDDPADDLAAHKSIAADTDCQVQVFPAFRPDKLFVTHDAAAFNAYIDRLGEAAGREIGSLQDLYDGIDNRMSYFHELGGRIADHGLAGPVHAEFTDDEARRLFAALRGGAALDSESGAKLQTAIMLELNRGYHDRGWTSQYHFGAMRNNNRRMFEKLGPDTGYDSMDDTPMARVLAAMLSAIEAHSGLPKTILYTNNPIFNEMMATMTGNFQDGEIPGKMQFGSGWWFNDQRDGMERQMTALANMGLLRRFVGMLTDSRSFLSFPRHEYFRRILCNLLGNWVQSGEVPDDVELLGSMVREICWENARDYFKLPIKG